MISVYGDLLVVLIYVSSRVQRTSKLLTLGLRSVHNHDFSANSTFNTRLAISFVLLLKMFPRGAASVHSSSAEAHEAALDAAGRVTPVRLGGSGWFINPGGVPRAPRGVIGLFCTLLYFTLLYFTLLYFTLNTIINLSNLISLTGQNSWVYWLSRTH